MGLSQCKPPAYPPVFVPRGAAGAGAAREPGNVSGPFGNGVSSLPEGRALAPCHTFILLASLALWDIFLINSGYRTDRSPLRSGAK